MNTPFPGVDPYLEHPHLWADVHDRFDLCLDYTKPPTPRLSPEDARWAAQVLAN